MACLVFWSADSTSRATSTLQRNTRRKQSTCGRVLRQTGFTAHCCLVVRRLLTMQTLTAAHQYLRNPPLFEAASICSVFAEINRLPHAKYQCQILTEYQLTGSWSSYIYVSGEASERCLLPRYTAQSTPATYPLRHCKSGFTDFSKPYTAFEQVPTSNSQYNHGLENRCPCASDH